MSLWFCLIEKSNDRVFQRETIFSSVILSIETLNLMPVLYCPKYGFSWLQLHYNFYNKPTIICRKTHCKWFLKERDKQLKDRKSKCDFTFICQSSTRNNTFKYNQRVFWGVFRAFWGRFYTELWIYEKFILNAWLRCWAERYLFSRFLTCNDFSIIWMDNSFLTLSSESTAFRNK